MNLHTTYPFPLLKHGILYSYPSLTESLETEVIVLGAGITGALLSWYLAKEGISTIVLDKRHVATGSTSASTSLLQYEIDVPLYKLSKLIGKSKAEESYRLCLEAISELKTICKQFENACSFENKYSFQYASYQKDVQNLKLEQQARKAAGFNTAFLNSRDVKDTLSINAPAALLSYDAAQADAYLLTHQLLQQVQKTTCRVYDKTEAVHIEYKNNHVIVTTNKGFTVKARKLVIACGYESQQYLPKKVEVLKSTYVIVSEPMCQKELWYKNSLIWETANPYLYLRTTPDQRMLIGGKDSPYINEHEQAARLNKKASLLHQSFKKLFPDISFITDFKWGGTFGTTKDGLPYIGCIPERPDTYFALGYGGNGITFSVVAAQIISKQIAGKKVTVPEQFSLNR